VKSGEENVKKAKMKENENNKMKSNRSMAMLLTCDNQWRNLKSVV